jgi:hypothetical protein
MKKISITLILSLTLLNSINLKQARIEANRSARNLKSAGYNYMSSRGTLLETGEYKTFKVLLYKGNTYAIFGTGDNSVKDIDVQVYDKDWNIVAQDYKSSGPIYAVQIKPKMTGVYYVRTCMFQGRGYFFQTIGWK